MKRLLGPALLVVFALVAPLVSPTPAPAARQEEFAPPEDDARQLALLLRGLDHTIRVLYVTAHPDDEDGGLLARLHWGEGVETALLTLTRGEGGQNEIGSELFGALGVLRTRELQAAARYTGVHQFFSRARDFGYSYSVEETFGIWNHDAVLRDVVRVVRAFHPDVILTLPPQAEGGGQHHQASARLAMEAYEIAGSDRWPELGPPHATARLFCQDWEGKPLRDSCVVDLGGYDPVIGASWAEVGMAEHAMHKCQGMAEVRDPLPRGVSRWDWRLARREVPHPLGALTEGMLEPLLENADGETPMGLDLHKLTASVRAAYRPEDPGSVVPDLLELWDVLQREKNVLGGEAAPADVRVRLATLEERAARALALALGIRVSARADRRFLAAGESLDVVVEAQNAGGSDMGVEVGFAGRALGGAVESDRDSTTMLALAPGGRATQRRRLAVAPDAEPTAARAVPTPTDTSTTDDWIDPAWSAFTWQAVLHVRGRVVTLPPEPLLTEEVDAAFPRIVRADPQVVPDPSVRGSRDVVAMPAATGDSAAVTVGYVVSSLRPGDLEVTLRLPGGWTSDPARRVVPSRGEGKERMVRFTVRPPAGSAEALDGKRHQVVAVARYADLPGETSSRGYQVISYPHIRPGTLLRTAEVSVVPFRCEAPRGVRVGYVEGTGDETMQAIAALGIPVQALDDRDLLEGDLDRFDVIVTGVRAYKVRQDLMAAQSRLLAWMKRGGVLVVQYNKYEFNPGGVEGKSDSPYAPWPGAWVGGGRVTKPDAPVQVLVPDDPVFHGPNRIGQTDWEGWVQERGLYFLGTSDARYRNLVRMEDPWRYNPGRKDGALVATRVGEGEWVYVGLGLFRQLPAGVPGAWRLLANLIALGGK